MKYYAEIKNKHDDTFFINSLDEFRESDKDFETFTNVMKDTAVRKYITDYVMGKYGFKTVSDLAVDILKSSPKKWMDREELRFIIRNELSDIVGMIGVDLKENQEGKLWYFKIATCPSFMFEALKEALGFLKKEKVIRLVADFKPDNVRTINLLERLVFTKTKKENEMEMYI